MSILNVNKINPVGGGSTVTIAGIASVTSSVTAPSFVGDVTGNVTGNVTGDATGLSGNPSINTTGIITATSYSGIGTSLTGVGKILQVVESGFTSSFQTGSTSFVDITSASVTITPTHANNKILVMVNLDSDYVAQTNALRVIYTQLLRDSTLVDKKAYYLGHGTSSNGYSYYGTPIDMLTLDSPNTTSAITYKVQGKTDSGNNNALFRVNMVTGQCASRLIAMEVAG